MTAAQSVAIAASRLRSWRFRYLIQSSEDNGPPLLAPTAPATRHDALLISAQRLAGQFGGIMPASQFAGDDEGHASSTKA